MVCFGKILLCIVPLNIYCVKRWISFLPQAFFFLCTAIIPLVIFGNSKLGDATKLEGIVGRLNSLRWSSKLVRVIEKLGNVSSMLIMCKLKKLKSTWRIYSCRGKVLSTQYMLPARLWNLWVEAWSHKRTRLLNHSSKALNQAMYAWDIFGRLTYVFIEYLLHGVVNI